MKRPVHLDYLEHGVDQVSGRRQVYVVPLGEVSLRVFSTPLSYWTPRVSGPVGRSVVLVGDTVGL